MIAAADSVEAVEFWTDQLLQASDDVQVAEAALSDYLELLPPDPEDQDSSTAQELEIPLLRASLGRSLVDKRAAPDSVGPTMMQGAARARAAPSGSDAVIALNVAVFAAMYTIFLHVDIAWEGRNVFLLALTMGMCTGPLDDEHRAMARSSGTSTGSTATAERVSSPDAAGAESVDLR